MSKSEKKLSVRIGRFSQNGSHIVTQVPLHNSTCSAAMRKRVMMAGNTMNFSSPIAKDNIMTNPLSYLYYRRGHS